MELEFEISDILESLDSPDLGEIKEALKLLEKHGDSSSISKIENLTNHTEVSIRYHAKRALNLISRRIGIKPKVSTAPKSQKKNEEIDVLELNIPEPVFDDEESYAFRNKILEISKNNENEKVEIPDIIQDIKNDSSTISKTEEINSDVDLNIDINSDVDEINSDVNIEEPPKLEIDKTNIEEITIDSEDLFGNIDESVSNITIDTGESDNLLSLLNQNNDGEIVKEIEKILKGNRKEPDSKTLKEMERYLLKSENPFIHASIVKLLGKFGGIKFIDSIAKFLNSTDFRVIANAIEGLEFINDQSILRMVAPYLRHDDNRIKANAAKCIWNINPEKGIMVLKKMISSSEYYYRDSGIYILGKIKCKESFELLIESYKTETSEDLIEKIKKLLSEEYNSFDKTYLETLLEELDEGKQEFIVSLLKNYNNINDSSTMNEKSDELSIDDVNMTIDSEITTEDVDISTTVEKEPITENKPPLIEETSVENMNEEVNIDISMDDLASELSNVNLETSDINIDIKLDGFEDFENDKTSNSNLKTDSDVEDNFNISVDLDNFSDEIDGKVETTSQTEENSFENLDINIDLDNLDTNSSSAENNNDFDISIDIDNFDMEVSSSSKTPVNKFKKEKIVPSGEDLLSMLSKKDVNSLDELINKSEPEEDIKPLSSIEVDDISKENLKPLNVYLRNVQSSEESLRVEAILGLFHYLKKEKISHSEKDTVEMYLDLARGDTSEKVRNILNKHS